MAGERQMPGLGLLSFWDLGSDYKDGMDRNLRKLSAVAQLAVESRTEALPEGPQGLIHIVPTGDATNPNKVAVYDRTEADAPGWVYLTPTEGWRAYVKDEDAFVTYVDGAWVGSAAIPSFGAGDAGKVLRVNDAGDGLETAEDASRVSSETVSADSYQATNADFRGGVLKQFTSANAVTVSVVSGVTNAEPLTLVQAGPQPVTVAPGVGVTINSKDGALVSGGQFGAMTLIPTALDTYLLVGDITA